MQRFRGVRQLIQLAEGSADKVQLFRVGKFYHPDYGTIEITKQDLASMVANFNSGVRGVDLAVDYAHENWDVAAGWIKALELSADGEEMWATVEWTPKGKEVISNKEYRYLSPEFTKQYEDNETLKKTGPTLLGAGLTNRPCIKQMEPVTQLAEDPLQACVSDKIGELIKEGHDQEQAAAIAYSKCRKELGLAEESGDSKPKQPVKKGPLNMDYKAMDPAMLDKMSPEELKAMVLELLKKLEELQAAGQDVQAQLTEIRKEKETTEKRAAFSKLLSEGKACKAQEEAYIAGDMVKFIELAQSVKLEEKGHGQTPEAPATKADAEKEILALATAKVKDKQAKNIGEAISLVLKENKLLHDATQA